MNRFLLTILVICITVILSACSGTGKGTEASEANGKAREIAEEADADKSADTSADTRVVQHAMGDKEIPANAQNLAVIDVVAFEDNLLALGVKPAIAPVFPWSEQRFLPYLADELEGSEGVDGSQPNLEQLLELKPDLILIEERHAEMYERFDLIAPTVIVSSDPNWRVRLQHLAAIVGKEREAETLLSDYDRKADSLKGKIKALGKGESVIIANMQDEKVIRVQGTTGHAVNELIYGELELTPAKGVPTDAVRVEISLEGLLDMNPDHIFLQKNRNQTAQEMLDRLMQDPIVANLSAFKNNQVYIIDEMLTKSWGVKGRSLLLDAVEQALTN